MPRMTSQILEAMDFIKAQESRYLENKKLITHQRLPYCKK